MDYDKLSLNIKKATITIMLSFFVAFVGMTIINLYLLSYTPDSTQTSNPPIEQALFLVSLVGMWCVSTSIIGTIVLITFTEIKKSHVVGVVMLFFQILIYCILQTFCIYYGQVLEEFGYNNIILPFGASGFLNLYTVSTHVIAWGVAIPLICCAVYYCTVLYDTITQDKNNG